MCTHAVASAPEKPNRLIRNAAASAQPCRGPLAARPAMHRDGAPRAPRQREEAVECRV